MALFLVQHGVCLTKDKDPQKGLAPLGIEETGRIAPVAAGYKIAVKQIYHSGKKRAEQTAKIYHRALGIDAPLAPMTGINPMDDVQAFAAALDPKCGWMVVGHMPFMERLVSFLTTGSEDILIYKFQNSGIVCLDAELNGDGKWNWFIKWTLNPNIT